MGEGKRKRTEGGNRERESVDEGNMSEGDQERERGETDRQVGR